MKIIMKIIFTIFLVILGLSVLVCMSSCRLFKEERFRNKLVENFVASDFDIDNSKYKPLKVDDILITVHIDNYDGYLINIEFYSRKQQFVFVKKVLVGNKTILINRQIDINYKIKDNLYSGMVFFPNSETLLSIKDKDFFNQVKAKKIPITVYFEINGKEKVITIEMEQYTVRDIAWAT